ncbi:C39 family peptidase [Prosthecobacter sp.]|uniref:C39 family peptidase n=1 Tax=Prosthecobacter sp. TaxID=1965333 RepID=UPI001D25A4FA|nr:C39 family peptidase [Prosthecobacter sp.]MCB1275525.1 C39 family peptidase [Prosthecobacter sp.]
MRHKQLLSILVVSLIVATAQGQPAKGDMDALIDWSDPMSLTQDNARKILDTMSLGERSAIYSYKHNDQVRQDYFALGEQVNPKCVLSLFTGKLPLRSVSLIFGPEGLRELSFSIHSDPQNEDFLRGELIKAAGGMKPEAYPSQGAQWILERFKMMTYRVQTNMPGGRQSTNPVYVKIQKAYTTDKKEAEARRNAPVLKANLDSMLSFSTLWSWSPDDLEQNYVLKLGDQDKQPEPPQFEWMSSTKDRARFSRHMFSNVETKLTMFGGSINVEEAILEFVNGKAARATISFYNRGDSGDIEVQEFDRIFKTVGQNLGQVTKVAPKRQIMSSNAALPVTGWMWSSPAGIALLEYNEYNTPGKVTKPEFLRLKLAAPDQADWSMGKMATGVQRMELLQRVTKTTEGDVYIAGVPMVDQGQKGYCVAASCQRLFEYMRIPCDQHEMAKLVSVDAENGADVVTMQKSLAKIDSAFKVTFKPLINPEQYYTAGRKRRVSEKQFVSIVREYVDKGVPLLWGLILGEKPEDPPLPGAGQTRGGHMRMVIGYNLAKNQILFTDSWGAGHELKRMAMLDAYDVTMGLYSMAPRGF